SPRRPPEKSLVMTAPRRGARRQVNVRELYSEGSGTPPGCDQINLALPVVSADSDHRLLSCNPSGCYSITQLHNLTGGESRGPGPLKVVATQLARHVNHFADKVEPGNAPGFHCL